MRLKIVIAVAAAAAVTAGFAMPRPDIGGVERPGQIATLEIGE
ncbi:hypothetical protein [Phenylobacterium sp.]|nr:hypothetical protein [Phenylobacterium sp.]